MLEVIPIYAFTKNSDIFLGTLSLAIYMLLINCFQYLKVDKLFKKYWNSLVSKKILRLVLKRIAAMHGICIIILLLLAITIQKIMHLDNVILVFAVMGINIVVIPMVETLGSYLGIKLQNLFLILYEIYLLVSSYLFFIIWKVPSYIGITGLWMGQVGIFTILIIILYRVMKRKETSHNKIINDKELKIEVNNAMKNNSHRVWIRIVNTGIVYLSVIILYIIMFNYYRYDYDSIVKVINDGYFYGYYVMMIMVILVMNITKDKIDNINSLIAKEDYQKASILISNFIGIFIKIILPIIIILAVISGNLWKVLFGNYDGANTMMLLWVMGLFMSLFLIMTKILGELKNRKIYIYILVSCVVIKLVITIPLINASYRMGYMLIYGDIVSNIICYVLGMTLSFIVIMYKLQINFGKLFDKLIGTIYECIILALLIILLQFKINMVVATRLEAIVVILVYVAISVVFYISKLMYTKNKKS